MSSDEEYDEKMETLEAEKDSPSRIHQRRRYINEVDIGIYRSPSVERVKGVDRTPTSQSKGAGSPAFINIGVSSDSDRYYNKVRTSKVFRKKEKNPKKSSVSIKIEF